MGQAPHNPASSLWQNGSFRVLFSAHAASLVGSGVSAVAIGLLAHELVGASATRVMGYALTIRIAVIVLLSPWAGMLADRWSIRRLLVISDLFRAGVVVAFFFVVHVWQIYALAVLLHAGSALFTPVYKSVVPGVVGEREYPKALAWGGVAYNMASILGPSLAGLVILIFGFRGSFLFDALTFIVSAILICGLSRLGQVSIEKKETVSRWHGMKAMLSRWPLRLSLWLALLVSVSGAFVLVATIGFVKEELSLPDSTYAWVMAAFGAGSVAGSLGYGKWEAKRDILAHATLPALLAGLLIIGLFPVLWLLFPCWIVIGAGQAILGIRGNELLARYSRGDERAHVYAAHFALSHAGWGITYPLSGWLAWEVGFAQAALWFGLFFGILAAPLVIYRIWLAWIHRNLSDAEHAHAHGSPKGLHSHPHRHGNHEHCHPHFHF